MTHNPIPKPVAYFPGEVVDLQERRRLLQGNVTKTNNEQCQ